MVFVLQGKNWFYHRLPAVIATVLGLLLWIAAMLPRRLRPPLGLGRLALPMSLALAALALFAQADVLRLRPWVEAAVEPGLSTEVRLERLIREKHATTYMAFSEWIGLGFPVVNNTGVTWASRFDSMWALKGELWRARQDGAAPRDWPIRRWVAHDFVAGCPELAVVDSRGGINYIAVLLASDTATSRRPGRSIARWRPSMGCGCSSAAPMAARRGPRVSAETEPLAAHGSSGSASQWVPASLRTSRSACCRLLGAGSVELAQQVRGRWPPPPAAP